MIRGCTFWILLLVLAVAPTAAVAQVSDTTPPTLSGLEVSPTTIDVTSGSQAVTVTADITDDLSGFRLLFVTFFSPSENQQRSRYIYASDHPSENPNNGSFSGVIDFSVNSEGGNWKISSVYLLDNANNSINWDTGRLEAAGFSTSLEVISNPDITPPMLTSMSITPSVIDVSTGDRDVTFRFSVTDDLSGLNTAPPPPTSRWQSLLSVYSPSFGQARYVNYSSLVPISGTRWNGVYETTIQIPQYSEEGEWEVRLTLYDSAGNRAIWSPSWGNWPTGFPSTFTVSSSPSDTKPPELKDMSFFPKVIDTSTGPQNVTVTLELEDHLSGLLDEFYVPPYYFSWGGVYFVSPSGGQVVLASLIQSDNQIIAGDRFSGTWQTQALFPQFSEAGTWKVADAYGSGAVGFMDRVRNRSALSRETLESMGFPTELVVVRPSLVGDGTVDGGGGTVQDETFGDRAQITLPPGAVQGPTDVSIDVFADSLDVPLPIGFEAAETYFVNVHLTPEPDYPLDSPGMTIVLPLRTWRIPTTSLHLYRIDPGTGDLVPAISTDDLPVIGTVDPSGMSATFEGVARLSVVVGLIPTTIPVGLDIKARSYPNIVNTKAKGLMPVAILGSNTFDVRTINITKLFFGPALTRPAHDLTSPHTYKDHLQDVNGDGFIDLVVHFDQTSTGLKTADTQACLSGETLDAIPIKGCDSITVIK